MAEKISVDLTTLGLESNSYKITVKAKSASYATSEAGLLSVDARCGLFNAEGKLVATWDNLVSSYSIRMQYTPELLYEDRMYTENEATFVTATTHPRYIIDDIYTTTTTIIIPDSVTVIPRYAFWNLTALTKIIIPKSIVKIGDNAFKGCTALAEICYEGTMEDWCKIDFASAGANPCFESAAGTIQINGSSGYYEVVNPVIPSGVTKISAYAFFGFNALESIVLPETLREIGRAAFHLNKYNKTRTRQRGSKTTFDIYFQGTIDMWNCITFADPTANPQFLGLLYFYESSGANSFTALSTKGIDLYNTDGDVVTIGKYQFADSGIIPSIKLPGSLEKLDRHAFYNCNSSSSNIDFYGNIKDWCNIRFLDLYANPLMNNTVDGCAGTKKVLAFYDANDGYRRTFNHVLAIPEGVHCVHYAQFANFDTQKIIFPSTLQSIRNHAFAFCHNTEIYDFRFVKQVPKLSDTFKAPDGYDGKHGRQYTTAFQGLVDCEGNSPKQILVPASLYLDYRADPTWKALDDYYEYITQEPLLIASDVERATSITLDVMAGDCFELIESYLPGLELIDWGDGTITNASTDTHTHYYNTAGIYEVKLYGVTQIGDQAFSSAGGCYYNNHLIISAYINPEVTYIGNEAFDGCTNLTSITFTEGLTRIGSLAFVNCTNLLEVSIPASVGYIGDGFCYNNGITMVDFRDPEGWSSDGVAGTIDSAVLEDASNAAYYMRSYYQSSFYKE